MTKLADYAYSDDGTPIIGASADAFSIGASVATDTALTDSDGRWDFTSLPNDGYDTRITYGSSVRWLRGQVSAQFDKITSYLDGVTAPLEDASIDASMLKNITADAGASVSSNTNSLTAWLGKLLTVLKAATGETNWYTAPSTSLSSIVSSFNTFVASGLVPTTAVLGSDTNILDTAWADGPSISLGAGTYWLTANAVIENTSGFNSSTIEIRIWDGTNTAAFAVSNLGSGANAWTSTSLSGQLTLATTTTIKLSCRELSGQASGSPYMKKASPIDSAAAGTQLTAMKVGS